MKRKVPDDAFALYVGLGVERSYDAVAKHYGVTKRTIARSAEREAWSKRLQSIEQKARQQADAKLADEIAQMNVRHRKLLLAMASRAASAIQSYPLESGMEGIRAAEVAIKLERLLAGEPNEHNAVTIERVTRDEMSRFLTEKSDDDEWGDDDPALEA